MKHSNLRCALYTRKSSEEGLDQEFNSLDAQREACAAYVASQTGEGWRALATRYDDGGYSGGSMDRPALQRLLSDIEAGRIDIVVVYKIDRLTRALADFARMVELFDRHGVSFVSVTQAFNTTTSMGRLTLNVLLSFAQFEREVTGERIRDKIAASKAKGMWMGGTLPFGYDRPADGSRALAVNAEEVATVRLIFATYLELGSVHELERHLRQCGVRSKRRTTAKGRVLGGTPFGRGALFHLLRNRIYCGLIVHKGTAHPGMHEAIIDEAIFEAVQARLDANVRRGSANDGRVARAPLTGRIFDAEGNPMSPTFSHGKKGKVYRYYVSTPLQQGRKVVGNAGPARRLPAADLEARLGAIIDRLTGKRMAGPLGLIDRVEIHADAAHLLMSLVHLRDIEARLQDGELVMPDRADPSRLRWIVPFIVCGNRSRTWITGGSAPVARPDATLIRALRNAWKLVEVDEQGMPVLMASPQSPYLRKLVRLAFLSPDIQGAILAGHQPPGLRLEHLMDSPIPLSWKEQHAHLGIRPGV